MAEKRSAGAEGNLMSVHVRPARRKRSTLSERDCLKALKEFALRVERMRETSDATAFESEFGSSGGTIVVQFLAHGRFGSTENLFEAIRVLAGYRLPRKGVAP